MNTNKLLLLCIFTLMYSFIYGQVIFIKTSNPEIRGESVDKGHENEIQALRYAQESSSCDITQNPGSGSCKVTNSSFAFDMRINSAIIGLKNAMYQAVHIEKIYITFRKPGAPPFEYYKITLGDVLVSKMTDATDGSSNVCQVQFTAAKFFWTYFPQSSTGAPATPITFGWDTQSNTSWNGQ